MSENPESLKNSTPKKEGGGIPEKKPPVKKGWSNPALRMLGIPRMSLPSRNWSIFWTLLATVGGGIAYDRYEQKRIRNKWMEKVQSLGEATYPNDRIPRKLSVFIAPPPNDYLEGSVKYFKKFVKPVINASAIDFELFTENRQGDIRAAVAERIRELRLEKIEQARKAEEETTRKQFEKSWTKFFMKDIPSFFSNKLGRQTQEKEVLASRQELYSPKDVLGFYYINESIDAKREDELNPLEAGGVICIGRGAYKEYMTGVHEGLLGPLEKPIEPKVEEIDPATEIDNQNDGEAVAHDKAIYELSPENVDLPKADTEASNENSTAPTEIPTEAGAEAPAVTDDSEEEKPVPKSFITPDAYATAEFAPEFAPDSIVKNAKNVPVLFEQPVYVFPLPKVSGFLNTHKKIYNFFTQRTIADDFGFRTMSIIHNVSRPFVFKDQYMAKEEELNWPKKWVASGKAKNSEWVQDLVVDERVTRRMKVFDPLLVPALDVVPPKPAK